MQPNPAPQHPFHYQSCRNISAPEDQAAARKVLRGVCRASELAGIPMTDGAPWPFDAPASTAVEDAILSTLRNRPRQFNVLNAGVVLTTGKADIDDAKRSMMLTNAKPVDGATTLRCLRRLQQEGGTTDPYVNFEIIVSDDAFLPAEVALSRRTQTDTSHRMSQAAVDLARSLGIQENEFAMRRIATTLVALMPPALFERLEAGSSKAVTYTSPGACLRAVARHLSDDSVVAFCRQLYPAAMRLHGRLQHHPALLDGRAEVPDGLLAPVLAAHAELVVEHRASEGGSHWTLRDMQAEDEAYLANDALRMLREVASSDHQVMGALSSCYLVLGIVSRALVVQRPSTDAASRPSRECPTH